MFSPSPYFAWMATAAMKSEDDCFLAGKLWQPRPCVKKQRHYSADKGPYSQGYGPQWSHTVVSHRHAKKVECWRIDAFKLWCWRILLRVLWTARRSNQSVLREINPEYSLEGLMLKLKFQYFGHLMWIVNTLGKSPWCSEGLRAEGEEGIRGWDGWMESLMQWT